jgi:exportin-T
MAISVVGDYVSWLDISLMVTPETVPIFFALLQHQVIGLRKASADALSEVVSKGMKPASKLELLQVLDLTTVVGALEAETRIKDSSGEQDIVVELRERLARLVNGITLELVKILEESATEESTRTIADELLVRHLTLTLAFLADEYDEPTECVLSGTNATLSYYKKLKRKAHANGNLSAAQLDVLARVVEVALSKMKYDDEAEWTGAGAHDGDGGASDEDEAHFLELRKQLQLILSAVASIDETIFSSRVEGLIGQTLEAVQSGLSGTGPQVTWQQAEMAVFAAYFYVEVLINASGLPKMGVSANTFVQMPSEAAKAPKNKLSLSIYPTLPLNTLGEAFQSVVQSNIASYPHPAVQLQFFECLNRYSSFFVARPDNLSAALFVFLDQRGLYSGHTAIRHRVWYLFSKFVRDVSGVIPRDYIKKVLDSMRVSEPCV